MLCGLRFKKHIIFHILYIEGWEPEGRKWHFWWNGDKYIKWKLLMSSFYWQKYCHPWVYKNQYTKSDQTMVKIYSCKVGEMSLTPFWFSHLDIIVAPLCPAFLKRADFLQSSSFWEARRALIGQLSSALWLAEYLKRETEMLSPLPYCDAVSRRGDTKTIKPIINEAFVAFSGDIITDYNDFYCLFTCRVASCRWICDRRNDKWQALLYTAQNSLLNSQCQIL